MSRKSQLDRIRRHLMAGRSITPLGAVVLFRCVRLSARIHDLRNKEGIPIITDRPMAREGRPFASYRIDPEWLVVNRNKKKR